MSEIALKIRNESQEISFSFEMSLSKGKYLEKNVSQVIAKHC